MKHLVIFLTVGLLIQIGCTPQTTTEETEEHIAISLEGTWRQVSYRNEDDTTWKSRPETVIYEKHITPTHFTWVSYETNQDSLMGTGGGTYTFNADNNIYTEDIEFFYPAGSNELGQAIPFSVEMIDGQWHHKGYAKVFEFDPDLGELLVVDSSVIDEIWERTSESVSDQSDGQLVGTWLQKSYKDSATDSLWSEYPSFVGYMKLVTPTHFTWIKYNTEGDQVMGLGGGTYSVSGGKYIENIKFFHPTRPGFNGATATFTWSQENDTWQIAGAVDDGSESPGQFEEIWVRYK